MWLRFVDGRSVGVLTVQFLTRTCEWLERLGRRALLLIWDNASWQTKGEVRGAPFLLDIFTKHPYHSPKMPLSERDQQACHSPNEPSLCFS